MDMSATAPLTIYKERLVFIADPSCEIDLTYRNEVIKTNLRDRNNTSCLSSKIHHSYDKEVQQRPRISPTARFIHRVLLRQRIVAPEIQQQVRLAIGNRAREVQSVRRLRIIQHLIQDRGE